MTSNELIIARLKEISKLFDGELFLYEHRESMGSHFVKIVSQSLFDSDLYKLQENNLWDEFTQVFPLEDLVFYSDSSLSDYIDSPNCEILDGTVLKIEETPLFQFLIGSNEFYSQNETSVTSFNVEQECVTDDYGLALAA